MFVDQLGTILAEKRVYALNPQFQASAELNRFRVQSVIDYVKFEIETVSSTNFMNVQGQIETMEGKGTKKTYVEPVGESPSHAASRFRITRHDIPTFEHLAEFVSRLHVRLPLTGSPRVTKIEVSVDFYSKRNLRDDLEAMTLRLKHTVQAQQVDHDWESNQITTNFWDLGLSRVDCTTLIRDGDADLRLYLKETDGKVPIADKVAHRARIEVTLNGDAIPPELRDASDMRPFEFAWLARHFAFRTIRPDAIAAIPRTRVTVHDVLKQREWMFALTRGQRALQPWHSGKNLPRLLGRIKDDRRKSSRLTQSDTPMKRRIRDALRDLTRKLYAEKAAKIASVSTDLSE